MHRNGGHGAQGSEAAPEALLPCPTPLAASAREADGAACRRHGAAAFQTVSVLGGPSGTLWPPQGDACLKMLG